MSRYTADLLKKRAYEKQSGMRQMMKSHFKKENKDSEYVSKLVFEEKEKVDDPFENCPLHLKDIGYHTEINGGRNVEILTSDEFRININGQTNNKNLQVKHKFPNKYKMNLRRIKWDMSMVRKWMKEGKPGDINENSVYKDVKINKVTEEYINEKWEIKETVEPTKKNNIWRDLVIQTKGGIDKIHDLYLSNEKNQLINIKDNYNSLKNIEHIMHCPIYIYCDKCKLFHRFRNLIERTRFIIDPSTEKVVKIQEYEKIQCWYHVGRDIEKKKKIDNNNN